MKAGRPKKEVSQAVLTERIEFRVSPAMKEWIAEYGYGAYLRQLVRRDAEAALANMELSSTEEERDAVRRVIG